jgi:hypothetical protein
LEESSLGYGNYSCRTGLGGSGNGYGDWTTSINGGNIYGGTTPGNVNVGSESGQMSYNNSVTIGYRAGIYACNRSVSIGYYTISGNDDTVVIGSYSGCCVITVGKQSILIGYKAGLFLRKCR